MPKQPFYIYRKREREKAEHQRIDTFELWCWRRLLRVPRTARRLNQSILKEINPECSMQELMLKLKLQHFGHLMQRTNSLEKTLMPGRIDAEVEAPILWPPDAKNQLIRKDLDSGKD